MKAWFTRHQYTFWTFYYAAVAILLSFGLLIEQDDTIKLFVGAGLVAAFSAGMACGRIAIRRPMGRSPLRRAPQAGGGAEQVGDRGRPANRYSSGDGKGANFVPNTTTVEQSEHFDF